MFDWLSPQTSIWRPALAASLPLMLGLMIGSNLEFSEHYLLADELELISTQAGSDLSALEALLEQAPQAQLT